MTTSFINETTVDQELQLAELSELNGGIAWVAPAVAIGAAFTLGWLTNELWDEVKEDVADAIHDAISDEKQGDCGQNSGSYREEPGSRGGGKGRKPVLK
ncbi:hypothetical protein [Synechococcus sp. RS9916]|uniref:hypothetical protein n=1 Tax=Synechococcus sp. RS9916 TaxID=221359 RepID=UPI0000E5362F|nr:hypothetical protein [Synechococcus sp. RS9916]EAU74585.1 hypothetical protein RS9916_33797 [Synechococcus sp. RS9916]